MSTHICRFDSAEHIVGKKRTYRAVKAAVLEAGRYSVFEATANERNAAIFSDIDRDPELIVERAQFPWFSVRLRTEVGAQGKRGT